MKHINVLYGLCLLCALAGCAGTPSAETVPETGTEPETGVITGINWLLMEIRTPEKTISIDRPALVKDGMGDVFSIRFQEEERVFGKGAPNRYTAPCSRSDDTISIGTPAGTLMAPLREPEALKEQEFFACLVQVKRWALIQGRLELYTPPDRNGRRTVLVFAAE